MKYGGVDLAADPKRTALAIISDDNGLVIDDLEVGIDDDAVVDVIVSTEKVGLDVPLGWPDPFVQLVSDHAHRTLRAPQTTGPDWRRTMAMRATDLAVRERTGKVPLSVSTDRIAYPALRWAGIDARLRADGVDVSRDGSGRICEVYPGAALHCWSLPSSGYKGRDRSAERVSLVEALSRIFDGIDWNGSEALCTDDDNALDAVVSALLARAVARGEATPPPVQLQDRVSREGWIWLPSESRL
ncbi:MULTISPECIES: DUF429 domain-containing protein [unclassified Brevibacterium]|uniref:DUF429 domain-containing protein n=1 Tax=unclassified Brevibacterium TaxID=2614124 RepID=UPI0010F6CE09|nr:MULTISPECIES: DUF429 domain-containing protein [unclassified Brevibacterium]MCM1014027.1 DUF429 domain-containing protein [Brevibacterium sp. XM4083]